MFIEFVVLIRLVRAGAGPLPLRVVQESLFGDHGSLALRSDGAALAHFLAARVDTQDHVKPVGGDDTCCGRTDSPCEGYAILASVLVEAALKVSSATVNRSLKLYTLLLIVKFAQ